jgi:hypothetical protein
MDEHRREDLPQELSEVEGLLREQRHVATPVELDRIKLRAKKQAAGRPAASGGFGRLGRRAVTLLIACGLVVSASGAAVAMTSKFHVLSHHHRHTASAAWFQYKPPCPPPKKHKWDGQAKDSKARAAWKHEDCKPPPPPPCSAKGNFSKAHAAGHKPCPPPPCSKFSKKAHAAGAPHGCPPPPCSKSSKARAAGATHGCPPPPCSKSSKAHAAGVSHGCDNTQAPDDTGTAPVTQQTPTGAPNIQTTAPVVVHHVKKHKAKRKHHRKHHIKRHVKKQTKKHSTRR